jgi:hypothetical protein
MADKRIGTIKPDGARVWPETDVYGASYSRPTTTHDISKTAFVVLPIGFVDLDGLLDNLRAQFGTPRVVVEAVEDAPPMEVFGDIDSDEA